MITPLVSVIVPVYNMGHIAERCLRNLLKQDYKNLEFIFIDDGSNDNSLDVCKQIALEDGRVKVYHTENQGSGPARNLGMSRASGEWVYFPDADDFLNRDSISILIEKINNQPNVDLLVFGFYEINDSGKILQTHSYPDKSYDAIKLRNDYSKCMGMSMPLGIQGAPWNKLFNMSVIKAHNIEFPSLLRHQDEGFISRYMCFVKKIIFISDVLYSYVVNDIRKTWNKYPMDYYSAVIGLYQIRKDTILKWNPADVITHELVLKEYICNIIKSLELAFSPKIKNANISKINYIKTILKTSGLLSHKIPPQLGIYQSIILSILKISPSAAIVPLYVKVMCNKLGLLR